MEQVEVIKQLYKKSEKPIEVVDEQGVVKKMTQRIKEKAGTMKFKCDYDYFKKHLMSHPDYSLSDKKSKADKADKAE